MASCYYTIIWKGADGTLYIPFDGEEFDDIELRLSTTGDSIVEISDFEVHDNFIVVPIESGELDLLPDGVIRYALTIDGVTDAGNLNAVLKTPDGYDGETADDIYQRGFDDGLESCSGDCSGVYEEGFEDGYASGQTDCSGYTQADLDNAFNRGYQSGFTDGLAACSGDTPSSGDTPHSGSTPLSGDYLTFEVLSSGTLYFVVADDNVRDIEYRRNTSEWHTLETTANTLWERYAEIYLNAGDVVQFRGENATYNGSSFRGTNGCVDGDCLKCNVKGNIMSLVYGDNYESATTLVSGGTFRQMFLQAGYLVSVDGLALPATTLTEGCYSWMFGGDLFENAPELPASIVPSGAYSLMFNGCQNLKYVKCLATDISATGAIDRWMPGGHPGGTFVKAASMNDWPSGTSGIPEGWTVVDAS